MGAVYIHVFIWKIPDSFIFSLTNLYLTKLVLILGDIIIKKIYFCLHESLILINKNMWQTRCDAADVGLGCPFGRNLRRTVHKHGVLFRSVFACVWPRAFGRRKSYRNLHICTAGCHSAPTDEFAACLFCKMSSHTRDTRTVLHPHELSSVVSSSCCLRTVRCTIYTDYCFFQFLYCVYRAFDSLRASH